MNDVTLKELKIVVERAVRPVEATTARKRQDAGGTAGPSRVHV